MGPSHWVFGGGWLQTNVGMQDFAGSTAKKLDDPVGVLSAHGLAAVWGTLACGLFTAPRFAQ